MNRLQQVRQLFTHDKDCQARVERLFDVSKNDIVAIEIPENESSP